MMSEKFNLWFSLKKYKSQVKVLEDAKKEK